MKCLSLFSPEDDVTVLSPGRLRIENINPKNLVYNTEYIEDLIEIHRFHNIQV